MIFNEKNVLMRIEGLILSFKNSQSNTPNGYFNQNRFF